MKLCCKCKIELPAGRKDRYCEFCRAEYHQGPAYVRWFKKRRAETKAFIKNCLKRRSCKDCGETDDRVLQFDHVRGRKKFCLSTAISSARSIASVKAEIKKCDVRCANCHIIRHYNLRHAL